MQNTEITKVSTLKRPQKASLRGAKRLLWSAILRTSKVIETSDDETLVVRAGHALAQLSSAFARIAEAAINEDTNKLLAIRVQRSLEEPNS